MRNVGREPRKMVFRIFELLNVAAWVWKCMKIVSCKSPLHIPIMFDGDTLPFEHTNGGKFHRSKYLSLEKIKTRKFRSIIKSRLKSRKLKILGFPLLPTIRNNFSNVRWKFSSLSFSSSLPSFSSICNENHFPSLHSRFEAVWRLKYLNSSKIKASRTRT